MWRYALIGCCLGLLAAAEPTAAEPAMVELVSSADFDARIAAESRIVLIDVWAESCGLCKKLTPILDELTRQYGDRVVVLRLNVDALLPLVDRLGIDSFPAVLQYRQGVKVDQFVGLKSLADIVAWLKL
jgi:thioredoxin 1